MKVGFISKGKPQNRKQWSGTVSYMYEEISKNHEIIVIDIDKKRPVLKFCQKVLAKGIRILTKKTYLATYSLLEAWCDSIFVSKIVSTTDLDVIFCPARSGSIAFLKTDVPIVYLTDGTFSQMVNYYPYLSNLSLITKISGEYIERNAIKNSRYVVAASDWTNASVVSDYHKSSVLVKTICFGANVSDKEKTQKRENKELILSSQEQINLLFCGVDWQRKGGPIAIETYRIMKQTGRKVRLWLVGCNPPSEIIDEDIVCVGFLDKNNKEDAKKLEEIYQIADFLLLPTTAECAGIVFTEASSFGIPSVTYDTGGISSYVRNGVNGFLLKQGSSAKDFADTIMRNYDDADTMLRLKRGCFNAYFQQFNWTNWGGEIESLFSRLGRG